MEVNNPLVVQFSLTRKKGLASAKDTKPFPDELPKLFCDSQSSRKENEETCSGNRYEQVGETEAEVCAETSKAKQISYKATDKGADNSKDDVPQQRAPASHY